MVLEDNTERFLNQKSNKTVENHGIDEINKFKKREILLIPRIVVVG